MKTYFEAQILLNYSNLTIFYTSCSPRLEVEIGWAVKVHLHYLKVFYSHTIHTLYMVAIDLLPGAYLYP